MSNKILHIFRCRNIVRSIDLKSLRLSNWHHDNKLHLDPRLQNRNQHWQHEHQPECNDLYLYQPVSRQPSENTAVCLTSRLLMMIWADISRWSTFQCFEETFSMKSGFKRGDWRERDPLVRIGSKIDLDLGYYLARAWLSKEYLWQSLLNLGLQVEADLLWGAAREGGA